MKQMRGIYAIPPTPFKENGDIDEQGMRSIIQFCLKSGAHGIVTPVNASEFISLTDEERQRVIRIAVEEVAGQIPVVAGVAGTCEQHAVFHATRAREAGADSLIAMPPYIYTANENQIVRYYQALDRAAAGLPVWIQNHFPPVGTAMTPELLVRIIQSTETVRYVKEECLPAGHYMTRTFELAGDMLAGIQGGAAGRYFIDEYARGACGTMPACEICDVHVQLWDALEAGDDRGARDIFNRMLPLLNLESLYGVVIYKEVLRRRGIIASAYVRNVGNSPLDAYNSKELDAVLTDLQPLFRI